MKRITETLVEVARRTGPPHTSRTSWITKLSPDIQQQLADLREIYRRGELVTGIGEGRSWTPSEVRRFVVARLGLNVSDNQFRPWLTQGSAHEA